MRDWAELWLDGEAPLLLRLLGHFGYAALVGLLVAGGLGAPVPEELVQLTAGYLARRGVLSFVPVVGLTWLGLLTGDYLFFRLARRHGPRVLDSRHVARVLTPARRAFIERHFARHAVLTIMAARHASGFRLAVFALAGATGAVRSWTFLLADGVSALLSVPLVVGLGWYFASHIEEVKKDLREAEWIVAALAAAFFLGWLAVGWLRARRARPQPPTG